MSKLFGTEIISQPTVQRDPFRASAPGRRVISVYRNGRKVDRFKHDQPLKARFLPKCGALR
jgi:hypothetical protein